MWACWHQIGPRTPSLPTSGCRAGLELTCSHSHPHSYSSNFLFYTKGQVSKTAARVPFDVFSVVSVNNHPMTSLVMTSEVMTSMNMMAEGRKRVWVYYCCVCVCFFGSSELPTFAKKDEASAWTTKGFVCCRRYDVGVIERVIFQHSSRQKARNVCHVTQ